MSTAATPRRRVWAVGTARELDRPWPSLPAPPGTHRLPHAHQHLGGGARRPGHGPGCSRARARDRRRAGLAADPGRAPGLSPGPGVPGLPAAGGGPGMVMLCGAFHFHNPGSHPCSGACPRSFTFPASRPPGARLRRHRGPQRPRIGRAAARHGGRAETLPPGTGRQPERGRCDASLLTGTRGLGEPPDMTAAGRDAACAHQAPS
jgi:hypothetical protein